MKKCSCSTSSEQMAGNIGLVLFLGSLFGTFIYYYSYVILKILNTIGVPIVILTTLIFTALFALYNRKKEQNQFTQTEQ